jgi:hypothetical protein
MIDWIKIKKYEETIKKNNEKLNFEKDFKKRERIKLKIKIEELKVKIEKLN